ncbi:hypothetical protein WAI453_004532 [Rhynchosporium graminicola]
MVPTDTHPIVDFAPFTSDDTPVSSWDDSTSLNPPHEASCTCSIQFSTILGALRRISSQKRLEADTSGSLSDSIYLAERHLFYLLKNADKFRGSHSPTCDSLGAACFVSARMYLYRTLRDFPFEVPVFMNF